MNSTMTPSCSLAFIPLDRRPLVPNFFLGWAAPPLVSSFYFFEGRVSCEGTPIDRLVISTNMLPDAGADMEQV